MSQFPETRESLLDRLRGLSATGAWQEFCRFYVPPILRVARYRGLSHADAEDLAQSVMLTLVTHLREFEYARDRGRFRQWVRTITENKICDFYRRRRPAQPLDAAGDLADPNPPPDEHWSRAWHLQDVTFAIDQAKDQVSPQTYQAFVMVAIEERPVEEVAQVLSLTPQKVYAARHRMLGQIRKVLGDSKSS